MFNWITACSVNYSTYNKKYLCKFLYFQFGLLTSFAFRPKKANKNFTTPVEFIALISNFIPKNLHPYFIQGHLVYWDTPIYKIRTPGITAWTGFT